MQIAALENILCDEFFVHAVYQKRSAYRAGTGEQPHVQLDKQRVVMF